MPIIDGLPKAVGVVRVSSLKQGLKGDSEDDQRILVERKANELGVELVKIFEFEQSAADEMNQPLSKVVDYCRESPIVIKYVIVKSIDRFTRAGSQVYMVLKNQFDVCGTTLIDTEGVIGGKKINTLEHIGLEYDFSIQNPSEEIERQKADEAHSRRDEILARLLGASGRYTIKGYATLPAIFGLKTVRIDTDDGERKIYKKNSPESDWIMAMFSLRLEGKSDDQIVDIVNKMGYVSRKTKVREGKRVVGYKGGVPLKKKQLRKYLSYPIYAGINTEKRLTQNKLKHVKARKYLGYDGLVTVDEFNRANNGKVVIVEDGVSPWVTILKDQPPDWQLKKTKDNPEYPYKKYILCPTCGKPFLASASKGKRKYYPAYHCSRKHKLYRVLKDEVHTTVENVVNHIEFSDEFKQDLATTIKEEWAKRRQEVGNQAQHITQNIGILQAQRDQIDQVINSLTKPKYIQAKEKELEVLDLQIAAAQDELQKTEKTRLDIHKLINRAYYFMEHLSELVLAGEDPLKNGQMFSLLFEELPTYEDLINGTLNLSPLFKLNEAYSKSKGTLSDPKGIQFEPLLAHFEQLRQMYETQEEEDENV